MKFESLHDALIQRGKVLHALNEAREALNVDDFAAAASALGFVRSALDVASDASLFRTKPDDGNRPLTWDPWTADTHFNYELERVWEAWIEYFERDVEMACAAYAKHGFLI